MAAGHRTSGAKRNAKRSGKSSGFSGLRIVLSAAAITVVILFAAFGAVGMLMLARAPQEPIAGKLDTNPPLVAQNEQPPYERPLNEPPVSVAPEPEPVVASVEEPIVIPATEPVPFATQQELERQQAALTPPTLAEAEDADPVAEVDDADAELETTATIPAPQATEKQEPQAKQKPVVVPQQRRVRRKPPPRQQRVVRRAVKKKAEPQSQNPLMQLFGVR